MMIDFLETVDEMMIDARSSIVDGGVLELDPSQFVYCMNSVIDRLRQAEKDAARYRWLRDTEISHAGGEAIDMDKKIDEAMQCNK